jgi:hypothetical protein
MPAAGPESIVRIGRRATSATSMTPPSLRMIMSGTRDARRARRRVAVICAVRSMRGQNRRVERGRPRARAQTVGRRRPRAPRSPEYAPRARAAATVRRLGGRADRRRTPRSRRSVSAPVCDQTHRCARRDRRFVVRARIGAPAARARRSASEGNRRNALVRALEPAEASRAVATTPTLRDVALEQGVRRLGRRVRDERDPRNGSSARRRRARAASPSTNARRRRPPRAECVVGTFTRATIFRGSHASTTTTSVNVPPTSIPTRKRVRTYPVTASGSAPASAARARSVCSTFSAHHDERCAACRRMRGLGFGKCRTPTRSWPSTFSTMSFVRIPATYAGPPGRTNARICPSFRS